MNGNSNWSSGPFFSLDDVPMPDRRDDAPPFEPVHRIARWLEPDEVESAVKTAVNERLSPDAPEMVDPRALGWDILQAIHMLPGATNEDAYIPKPSRDEVIEAMVNRFLNWKLPDDFSPDCGIRYKEPKSGVKPIGTNLLTFDQAKAMLLAVVFGDGHPF